MTTRRHWLATPSLGHRPRRLRLAAPLAAQPAQTTVLSGFPVGGLGDQVTRPLIERLKGRMPAMLIYDAKPGAGGRIAADAVKRAAPDGALAAAGAVVADRAVSAHLQGKLGYDPLADFVPVTPLAAYTFSMTVGPGACRPKSRRWPTSCAGPAPIRTRPTTASRRRARCCTSSA